MKNEINLTAIGVPLDTIPETDEEIVMRRLEKSRTDFTAARIEYFNRVCPVHYRVFNRELCSDTVAHDLIVAVMCSGKSCFVVGKVGAGKTFAVWAALGKMIMRGINPAVYSAVTFNARASEAFANVADTEDWLDYVLSTSVLVLDDWAKEAMSDPQERAFFEIIERRTSEAKQTVLVTSRSAKEILQQAVDKNKSGSRMPDIMRRLAQRFEVVRFKE